MSGPRFVLVLLPAFLAILATAAEPSPLGSKVGNLSFTDIRYTQRSLDDLGKPKATVVIFTINGCPLAPMYLAVLDKMEREYRSKGVQFLAVNVGSDETIVEMAAQMVELGVAFPVVKDFDGKVVAALGATRTPEVVLLDADRVIRYRGRVDDQYRPGFTGKAPTRHDLKEALDEVLAGKKVSVPETTVDGCFITRPERTVPAQPVTFAEQVGPLLIKHCAGCHRPGAEAPFSLTTYEQTRARGRAIVEVVREGRMPPWFASPDHGKFTNQRGLSVRERDLVAQWVDGGMQPGNLAKAPTPPAPRTEKWQIEEPDLVLTTDTFDLPATGDIAYQYAVFNHPFTEDTWVQGVEILPENRRLVHHANLAHASLGGGFSEANFITGVVPGGEPMRLDQGVAYKIPKGSILGLQIHFVSSGKEEKTRLSVGLRFARGKIQKKLQHVLLVDKRFAIPPGEPAHPVRASRVLDRDVIGVGLFTHMHLRGKAMVFRAILPDGKVQTLLSIPNYRFDWQLAYHFDPDKMRLPKGTRLEAVALYDNSAFNPFNPDPKDTVRDGPQTYNEMFNGFVFFLDAGEQLGLEIDGKTGHAVKPK
jgi:hypothetical protein